jgi:hypothetical protein
MTSAAGVDAAKKKGGKKGGKKAKAPLVLVLEGKVVTNDTYYWFRPDKGQHKIESIWDMELDVKKFNKLLKEKKASTPSFPYESIKQCIDQPIALKLEGVTFKDKKKTVLKTNKSTILGMAVSKKDLE